MMCNLCHLTDFQPSKVLFCIFFSLVSSRATCTIHILFHQDHDLNQTLFHLDLVQPVLCFIQFHPCLGFIQIFSVRDNILLIFIALQLSKGFIFLKTAFFRVWFFTFDKKTRRNKEFCCPFPASKISRFIHPFSS